MIDADSLRAAGACSPGVEWVAARADRTGDLVDGMLAEQRLDFYAWGFLRMPKLRRRGDAERMAAILGPNHVAIGVLADRIARAKWLTREVPDDELAADRVRSHLRRLSAFGFIPPTVVRIRRMSMAEAHASTFPLAAAVRVDDGLPAPDVARAWATAFWRARRALAPRETKSSRDWLRSRQRIEATLVAKLEAHGAHITSPLVRVLDGLAVHAAYRHARAGFRAADPARWLVAGARADIVCHALHLLADVEAKSPYEPLVDLWLRGYWPAGIAGDTFCVGDPQLGWVS